MRGKKIRVGSYSRTLSSPPPPPPPSEPDEGLTSGSLAQLKDLRDCVGLGVGFLRVRVKWPGGAWGMGAPGSVCVCV